MLIHFQQNQGTTFLQYCDQIIRIIAKDMTYTITITNILLFCLCFQLVKPAQYLPDDISNSRYNLHKIPPNFQIYSEYDLISLRFPSTSYQISSQFYIQEGPMTQETIYNKSAYSQKHQTSCVLFPTDIQIKTVNFVSMEEQARVLKYYLVHGDKKGQLYVLTSDSQVLHYLVDPMNIKLIGNYSIDSSISMVVDHELQENVQILEVNEKIYFFNKDKAFVLVNEGDHKYFREIEGYDVSGLMIRKAAVIEGKNNVFWVSTDQQINIFTIQSNGDFSLSKKIKGFSNETITAIECRHMKNGQNLYYVATIDLLFIISDASETPVIKEYTVNGSCTQMSIIKDTLFLGCEYEHINFVIEAQLNGSEAKLNRFYDDSTVEGVRKVVPIGYDKMGIIGDQSLVIIGEAVNRYLLLDLEARKKKQMKIQFYSLGLIDFFNLKEYSSQIDSCILTITEKQIAIVRIFQNVPEMECYFERSQVGATVTILAVFNTTHCPYSILDETTLGGTYLVCETFYPYQIALSSNLMEQKTANLFFFVILLLLIMLNLICAGCGLKIRNQANATMKMLRNKIDSLKKKGEDSKELKQI